MFIAKLYRISRATQIQKNYRVLQNKVQNI